MFVKTYNLEDEVATRLFGASLAKCLRAGDTLALVGDLAAGKTTLSQAIGKSLGIKTIMRSPTFALVSEYPLERGKLIHSDVYRLSDEDELFAIGFEEYFTGENIIIVEWANLIMPFLEEYSDNLIIIEIKKNGNQRILTLKSTREMDIVKY